MATVSCPCCLVEISADRDLCVECGGPPDGSPRSNAHPSSCPHRGRVPFPKNALPWHGHRYGCLCSVTGVIEEDDHADTR